MPIRLTKIGLASVVAAPIDLSPGDIDQINAMGYEGALDIADRVHRHNNENATPLMVPLSAQLAQSGLK